MQLIVDHGALRNALNLCVSASSKVIPILANVLLTAKDDVLTIANTDLELTVITQVTAVVRENGTETVSLESLASIAKTASEPISITTAENGRLNITTGSSKYALPTLSPEDYPTLPTMTDDGSPSECREIELSASEILPMIATVSYSQTTEETRFQLAGALMKIENGSIDLVTTNGHAMALCSLPHKSPNGSTFLPANLLRAMNKLTSKTGAMIEIAWTRGFVSSTAGATQIIARKADANFPNYREVIPKSHSKRVTCDTERFRSAISRVAPFSLSKAIRCDLSNGSIKLSTENAERGMGVDIVPSDYAGESMTIGFDSSLVSGAISTIDTAQVCLEFEDKRSAIVMRPVNSELPFVAIHIIMPMELK